MKMEALRCTHLWKKVFSGSSPSTVPSFDAIIGRLSSGVLPFTILTALTLGLKSLVCPASIFALLQLIPNTSPCKSNESIMVCAQPLLKLFADVTEVDVCQDFVAGSYIPIRTSFAWDDISGASYETNSALRVEGSQWISARGTMNEGQVSIGWMEMVSLRLSRQLLPATSAANTANVMMGNFMLMRDSYLKKSSRGFRGSPKYQDQRKNPTQRVISQRSWQIAPSRLVMNEMFKSTTLPASGYIYQ